MSGYIEFKTRAYFDEVSGGIKIISKDRRFKGKPFQISLNRETATFNTLIKELEDSGAVNIEDTYSKLPKFIELPETLIKLEKSNEVEIPIGVNSKLEVSTLKLLHAPHTLICGATGSGKSQLLRTITRQVMDGHINAHIVSIAKPADSLLRAYAPRVGDIDAVTVDEALEALNKVRNHLDRTYKFLEDQELMHVADLKAFVPTFIMIDEAFHFLSPSGIKSEDGVILDAKKKEILELLNMFARLGRSVGVYLFIATQRPDATFIPGELKANLSHRILFGLSESIVDNMVMNANAKFVNSVRQGPGRFILSTYGKQSLGQAYIVTESN